DTSATLKGTQANLRKTINTLSPFLVQLTPQVGTTAGYLGNGLPTLRAEMTTLIPEVVSAISGQDAGGNYLRQFVVINPCYDLLSKTRANPKGNCLAQVASPGASPLAGAGASKTSGSKTKGTTRKRRRAHCPAPSATATPRPTPTPSLLPLPSPSATNCAKSKPRSGTRSPSPSPSPSSGGLLGSIFGFFGGGS
ncbi:MAG: hypothetical protein J2P34_08375, partial [Actinobacteria bacterium]|nr:hypothetical protein [Actinomycetota bacterium]